MTITRNVGRGAVTILLLCVLALAGCGGGDDDGDSGGNADQGEEAMEDIDAALAEGEEACGELLAAGEAFTAEDVETCKGGVSSGFDCPNGSEVTVVEDADGAGQWLIIDGAVPTLVPEAEYTVDAVMQACPTE